MWWSVHGRLSQVVVVLFTAAAAAANGVECLAPVPPATSRPYSHIVRRSVALDFAGTATTTATTTAAAAPTITLTELAALQVHIPKLTTAQQCCSEFRSTLEDQDADGTCRVDSDRASFHDALRNVVAGRNTIPTVILTASQLRKAVEVTGCEILLRSALAHDTNISDNDSSSLSHAWLSMSRLVSMMARNGGFADMSSAAEARANAVVFATASTRHWPSSAFSRLALIEALESNNELDKAAKALRELMSLYRTTTAANRTSTNTKSDMFTSRKNDGGGLVSTTATLSSSTEWTEFADVVAKLGHPTMAYESYLRAIELDGTATEPARKLLHLANALGMERDVRQRLTTRRKFPDQPPPTTTSAGVEYTVATTPSPDRDDDDERCWGRGGDRLQLRSAEALNASARKAMATAYLSTSASVSLLARATSFRRVLSKRLATEQGRAACNVFQDTEPTMLWHYAVSALTAMKRPKHQDGGGSRDVHSATTERQNVELVKYVLSAFQEHDKSLMTLDPPYPAQSWADDSFPIQAITVPKLLCASGRQSRKTRQSDAVNASRGLLDYVHALDVVGLRSFLRRHKYLGTEWLNQQDRIGYTPLHHAIIYGDTLSFAVLLRAGANPFHGRNLFNQTPADMLQSSLCLNDGWSKQAEPMLEMVFSNSTGQAVGPPEVENETTGECSAFQRRWEDDEWEHFDVLSSWRALQHMPTPPDRGVFRVDARSVALRRVIRDFVSAGRPVVIENALAGCSEIWRNWTKASVLRSPLAALTYKAYAVPFGEAGEEHEAASVTAGDFIRKNLGRSAALTNTSIPRYIFSTSSDALADVNIDEHDRAFMHPVVGALECMPLGLQQYLNLPPPRAPGAWQQWTIGIGGSGSGTPFHVHLKAINLLMVGTKRWFIRPPAHSTYSTVPIYQWMRDEYPKHRGQKDLIEFVQHAGDIVILPAWVNHATMCAGDCIGMAKVLERFQGGRAHPEGPLVETALTANEQLQLGETALDTELFADVL